MFFKRTAGNLRNSIASRKVNRSKLRNRFLKTRNEESKRCFNRQRNFCVSWLCKTKRRFFRKLDYRIVSDNRKFWKTVGPLLSEKTLDKETIILNNSNKTISNNEELAIVFYKHLSKLVENLDTNETLGSNIGSSDITDPVFNAIKKYKYHRSM